MTAQDSQPVKLFIIYSFRDEMLKNELESHLYLLIKDNIISTWDTRRISIGKEWEKEIALNLETADIILVLVSPNLLISDYAWNFEMKRAISLHESGKSIIIPILLNECDIKATPLSSIKHLPDNGISITLWLNRDHAYLNIINNIEKIISHHKNSELEEHNKLKNEHDLIISLNSYAESLIELAKYEKAKQVIDRALSIDSTNNNRAVTLTHYAQVLSRTGDYAKADTIFQKALALLPEDNIKAFIHHCYANTLKKISNYQRAIEQHENSLNCELEDKQKAITLNAYANTLKKTGSYDQAIELYEKALTCDIDDKSKIITLNAYANILKEIGSYEKAIDLYEKALNCDSDDKQKAITLNAYVYALDRIDDNENDNIIIHYIRVGESYYELLKLKESKDCFNKALEIAERIYDRGHPNIALICHNLGGIYFSFENYKEAKYYFEKALKINQIHLGSKHPEVADELYHLGLTIEKQQQPEQARIYYKQAYEIVKHEKNAIMPIYQNLKTALADINFYIASYYVYDGKWYDGLHLLEESLSLYREGDNLLAHGDTLYQMALTHQMMGNLDQSRTLFFDALRLYQHEHDLELIAMCKKSMAILMIEMRYSNKAIQLCNEVLAIYQQLGMDKEIQTFQKITKLIEQQDKKDSNYA